MREIFKYRDLIAALVARELKVRYRRSAIGFAWTMLQPLLTMLVLQVVFSSLFRFRLDDENNNYPVYALAGILFWNFFSQSIVASMNSLRGNSPILRKLPVPREVFPLLIDWLDQHQPGRPVGIRSTLAPPVASEQALSSPQQ